MYSFPFVGHFPFAGLYTTFIFQKPDPDVAPPLTTPLLHDVTYIQDEASILKFAKNTLKLGLRSMTSLLVTEKSTILILIINLF